MGWLGIGYLDNYDNHDNDDNYFTDLRHIHPFIQSLHAHPDEKKLRV
jgi:hypothetical protein